MSENGNPSDNSSATVIFASLLFHLHFLNTTHILNIICKPAKSICILWAFVFYSLSITAQSNKQLDSLQVLLKVTTHNDTLKANILGQIARIYLYDFNNIEKMKQYATQAIQLSQKTNFKKGLAPGYLYYGVYYNNMANYKYAMTYYLRALKLYEELKDIKALGSCYINIGSIYGTQGNYKNALAYMQKGASYKAAANDKKGTSIAFNNIGNIYSDQGNYPEAISYLMKSLKIKEDIKDKSGISIAYNNIGLILELQGKIEEAIAYHLKSLKLKEELNDRLGASFSYSNLAALYMNQKKYKEAQNYNFKSLKIKEELGDKQGEALCLGNIGTVYMNENKTKEALKYQLKALKIMEDIGDAKALVTTLIALGSTYEKEHSYPEALVYYDKGLKKAIEIDYRDGVRQAYGNLSSVYTLLKNYQKALEYTNLFYHEKDSLFNKEAMKQVTEINTKYQTEKKEQEIQLLTKDQQLKDKTLREQRVIRIALIVGLALFFILSFTLYNRYRFKQKANTLLEKQKQEIQEQNILITDSIDYAKTIQEAVFPSEKKMMSLFPDSFVLYKPKAIVSGDFYLVGEKDNKLICTVADCTGHGIPGAFMSLLGFNMLENIIEKKDDYLPSVILNELNQKMVATMSQDVDHTNSSVKHGMDASVITIDKQLMQLQFAGAHNPLYQVRDNTLTEIKADKMSIGSYKEGKQIEFQNHTLSIRKGDVFYLFSDGFPDQIGGPNRKKFYYPPFKELLVSIHKMAMTEQKNFLDQVITSWKGERDQTDDILVVGIKI
jgi:serine phosphatase RsbU (regulator of sigma subunit)